MHSPRLFVEKSDFFERNFTSLGRRCFYKGVSFPREESLRHHSQIKLCRKHYRVSLRQLSVGLGRSSCYNRNVKLVRHQAKKVLVSVYIINEQQIATFHYEGMFTWEVWHALPNLTKVQEAIILPPPHPTPPPTLPFLCPITHQVLKSVLSRRTSNSDFNRNLTLSSSI